MESSPRTAQRLQARAPGRRCRRCPALVGGARRTRLREERAHTRWEPSGVRVDCAAGGIWDADMRLVVFRRGRDPGYSRTICLPGGREDGRARVGGVPRAPRKGAPGGATQWRADHRGGRLSGCALGRESQRRGHADSAEARRTCPASRRDATNLSHRDKNRPIGRLQGVLCRRARGEP